MATFAIGDLQGCADEFAQLTAQIGFDKRPDDRLWLVGDLVSRGPDSLACLRKVYALRERLNCVLGNHDLHLLAQAAGVSPKRRGDLDAIVAANDAEDLLTWLRHRPLLHFDAQRNLAMVHAGLPPEWTIDDALTEADAVQQVLRGPKYRSLLAGMYGDGPRQWSPKLRGLERQRFAINCFTRLRYCDRDGSLLLDHKMPPGEAPPGATPWFSAAGRASRGTGVVFGHWSTLGQVQWPDHNVRGLDTGCVWGGALTALDIDSGDLHSLACRSHRQPG